MDRRAFVHHSGAGLVPALLASAVLLPEGEAAASSRGRGEAEASKNVKDFGAKGDGVANDTTAIQSAINAASADRGGVVFFPAGV